MINIPEHIVLAYPVVGCTIDCPFCYAKAMNAEYHYVEDFSKPQLLPNYEEQLTKYSNCIYMVTGMSDISEWETSWIVDVFKIIYAHPENIYLFLTKRPENVDISCSFDNVWFGVSVINKESKYRLEALKDLEIKNKFVAFEPIQEDLGELDLSGVQWLSMCKELPYRSDYVEPDKQWFDNILNQSGDLPVLMKNSLKEMFGSDFRQELPEVMVRCINTNVVSDTYKEVTDRKEEER